MEQHHMEILFEDIRSKFDLVLEGHAALHAQIEDVRREFSQKHELTQALLGAVAADLAAHRADTEAHPRYIVRE